MINVKISPRAPSFLRGRAPELVAWFTILRRHRVMRASAAAIFLYGVAGAATSPYQSLIAIRELGMSDHAYAAVSFAASVGYVVMAIGVGLISDRFQRYRKPLIFVTSFGVLGYGMIWASPSVTTFALMTLGPLALFHATNSMLFGNVKAHTARFATEEAQIANALMRIMVSLAWVLVPGAVGFFLRGQSSMISAYLIAAALAFGCVLTVMFWLEPDQTATRVKGPALKDLHKVANLGLFARVLGVALISQVLHINAAVLPLLVTGPAHGSTEDVGLLVGMVAVLEVIFMLFWARAIRRVALTHALMLCAFLYLCYLGGISLATSPWQVYLASVIAGFAAAGIVSLPIGYLLELINNRPGLSASLLAVNSFAGGALGAIIFAIGTDIGTYGTAAFISGIAGCLGAALLFGLERETP